MLFNNFFLSLFLKKLCTIILDLLLENILYYFQFSKFFFCKFILVVFVNMVITMLCILIACLEQRSIMIFLTHLLALCDGIGRIQLQQFFSELGDCILSIVFMLLNIPSVS